MELYQVSGPEHLVESRELGGKTLGLLGFGVIGKKVSRLAQVFGANVIAYDPFVQSSDAEKSRCFIDLVKRSFLVFLMLYQFTFHLLMKLEI